MGSEILKTCMKKGFLLDKEMLDLFSGLEESRGIEIIEVLGSAGINERVITKKIFTKHLEKFKYFLKDSEKNEDINSLFESSTLKQASEQTNQDEEENSNELKTGKVKFISAPAFPQKKIVVKDFVNHFKYRYESIRSSFR